VREKLHHAVFEKKASGLPPAAYHAGGAAPSPPLEGRGHPDPPVGEH
jgi:hypothetical protein